MTPIRHSPAELRLTESRPSCRLDKYPPCLKADQENCSSVGFDIWITHSAAAANSDDVPVLCRRRRAAVEIARDMAQDLRGRIAENGAIERGQVYCETVNPHCFCSISICFVMRMAFCA
jgi:hypothetical protein